MMDIKSVGFDFDNTLYEPNPEINEKIREYVCRHASEALNKSYASIRKKFDELYLETESGSESLKLLGISEGKVLMQEALEKADIASVLKKDDRLVRVLSKLNESYRLFLITGSSERISLKKLGVLGINPDLFHPKLYFDSPFLREDGGSAFKYVSELHGVSLEQMMFVGDREQIDIIPANELGLTTAIVNGKSKIATYELLDIYELEEILL